MLVLANVLHLILAAGLCGCASCLLLFLLLAGTVLCTLLTLAARTCRYAFRILLTVGPTRLSLGAVFPVPTTAVMFTVLAGSVFVSCTVLSLTTSSLTRAVFTSTTSTTSRAMFTSTSSTGTLSCCTMRTGATRASVCTTLTGTSRAAAFMFFTRFLQYRAMQAPVVGTWRRARCGTHPLALH